MFTPSRLWLALAAALASEVACPPAQAQTTEPALRMSRELARPAPPTDPKTGKRAPLTFDSPEQGTLFLRADRLEGTKGRVEASGQVELRSRRETVLADFLSYDFETQEIHGRGNVLLRQGNDFVRGPGAQVQARHRDRRVRVAAVPGRRDRRARRRRQGHVRRSRPVRDPARPRDDLRGAARGLVPAGGQDRHRHREEGRRRARCAARFHGRADPVFAVARVPAVQRAQVRLPHADARLVRHARHRLRVALLLQPRAELRRDGDAAHHDQARRADRRRVALPVQRRRDAEPGPGVRRGAAGRSADRHDALAVLVAAQPAVHAVARRLLQPEQGLGRQVLRGPVRARRGHVAVDAGARGRLRWRRSARCRCSRAPRSSRRCRTRTRRSRRRTTACRRSWARLRTSSGGGFTFSGIGEYARFQRPGAATTDGDRAVLYPQVEWRRQGSYWFFAARGSVHARQYDLETPLADGERRPNVVVPIASLDGGLVFERPWKAFGTRLHPDARAARVLRLHPVPQPERASGVRHGAGRLQLLAALHREPLRRQRPHRRHEPADARRDVAPARSVERRRADAVRDRPALLLRGPAGDPAERDAALELVVGHPARRGGSPVRRVAAERPRPVQPRLRRYRAPEPRRALEPRARQGDRRKLSLHAPARRPGRIGQRAQAVRHRDAVADHAAVDDARPLELLAGAEQDAGGAGGL